MTNKNTACGCADNNRSTRPHSSVKQHTNDEYKGERFLLAYNNTFYDHLLWNIHSGHRCTTDSIIYIRILWAGVQSTHQPLRRSDLQHKHLYSMFRSKEAFQYLFTEGPHARIHLRSGLGKMEILQEGEKLDNCEKTLHSAVPGEERRGGR